MSKFYKYLLIASLSFNFLIVVFIIGKRYYYSHSYIPPLPHKSIIDSLNELRALPIHDSDIVFVGDSETEWFPLEEMFPSKPVRNRGIVGNTSADILNRIESIADAKPRKILLELGINDILRNIPLDTLFINYHRILKMIQSKSPTTKIYIQSLLPVGKKFETHEPLVVTFNKKLKELAEKNSVTFINIFPPFCTDGLLDSYYSKDDLHLNRSGYEIWRNLIARYVN